MRLRSAQMLGNWEGGARGMFSEYQDVVAPAAYGQDVREAVISALAVQLDCDEIILGCAATPDSWQRVLRSSAGLYVRGDLDNSAYQADLSPGFASYTRALGASTRRSLLNLRSRLESKGKVAFARAPAHDCEATLDELMRLHALRWGSPPFSERVRQFHVDLFKRWCDSGRILLHTLHVNDRCIGALYDVRVEATQYNIQMGFDTDFEPKVSLGLLLLGYAMEFASSEGALKYDFLMGAGKKADYKKNLASGVTPVGHIQALSAVLPKLIYSAWDRFR
jgi:CelD/BcsL family acetyltransferase involved in cellulose biosynthesis